MQAAIKNNEDTFSTSRPSLVRTTGDKINSTKGTTVVAVCSMESQVSLKVGRGGKHSDSSCSINTGDFAGG